MSSLNQIKSLLQLSATIPKQTTFFKTAPGQYAAHDQFIGVNNPTLRKIAKQFPNLTLSALKALLESPYNEERLLALFILVSQYNKATPDIKDELYNFYLNNLKHVNNWNLVDASAHLIIGAHLLTSDKAILLTLAKSDIMWERRIAIVSTWFFIRNDDLEWTFKISELLLNDPHDLIHKAVGWMLREAGKRNQAPLLTFLDQYTHQMPRTMLRYAIEKLPESQRKAYLKRR